MAPHHSSDSLRKALVQFALGKGLTGFTTVVCLAAMVKLLPITDFGVYATLQAVVVIVGAVSSYGINQAALRFLPELRVLGQMRSVYLLVWRTTATRVAASALGFAVVGIGLPWFGRFLGFEAQLPWVLLYFAVGTLRLSSQFLSSALETLLLPKLSQTALALAACIRLLAVLAAAGTAQLRLSTVVLIELACELAALLLLAHGLRRQQRRDPHAHEGDADWLVRNRGRLSAYGRWNYLTSLLGLLATTAPYRMLAPMLLPADKAALMGLAYSVCDLLYRFLPAKMGRLVLRSVLVANHAVGAGVSTTVERLRLNFAVNALPVAVFTACMLGGGSEALLWASDGKYPKAGPVLAASAAVLLLELWRLNYELLFSITEQNRQASWSSLGLMAGPAAAWGLAPGLGLWALPLGAALGQFACVALVFLAMPQTRALRLTTARSWLFSVAAIAAGAGLTVLSPDPGFVAQLAFVLVICAVIGVIFKPVPWSRLKNMGRANLPAKSASD